MIIYDILLLIENIINIKWNFGFFYEMFMWNIWIIIIYIKLNKIFYKSR